MPSKTRKTSLGKSILTFVSMLFFLCIACVVVSVIFSPDDENADKTQTTEHAVARKVESSDQQGSQTEEPTVSPTDTVEPTATATPTPAPNVIIGQNTYLRAGPGSNFQAMELVNQGDELPVFARDESSVWLLVSAESQLWVQAAVATPENPVDSLPVAPTTTPTATNTTPPSRTPIPTNTPRPSPTPIPAIRIQYIYENYESMTELQFKEYKQTIVGKPVREPVEIGNVEDDGKIIVTGDWSPFLFNVWDFCVVVTGAPKDVAITLNGGDDVHLEATINGIVSDYSYYFNCDTALILSYKSIEK